MSTVKGKPRGYFDYLLAIDCETTGLCFKSDSPVYNPNTGERHQVVSWGIVVADSQTLLPVEELYVEVKWNNESKRQQAENPQFGLKAEQIHGLTQAHLEQNGLTEQEAVLKIAEPIMKYWGDTSIRTLGHNVHMFDLVFFRDMFARQDVHLRFGNRHYDTNSVGFINMVTWTSDGLFKEMGFADRGDHNALEDAKMALESARRVRLIFQKAING